MTVEKLAKEIYERIPNSVWNYERKQIKDSYRKIARWILENFSENKK